MEVLIEDVALRFGRRDSRGDARRRVRFTSVMDVDPE